jgi:2,5-furandicarboxylate decarboxylase 1
MSALVSEPQSLREFLAVLESRGALMRVSRQVDLVHELSAYLSETERGPAVLFERTSAGLPVVGNVLNSRERIGLALGVESAATEATIAAAVDAPLQPELVDAAPWQAVTVESPDLAALPVPTFFEHESGPYITAGVIVARDPETGRRNVSIARLKLLGGNRAYIGIAPNHHLSALARKARARGERLDLAVTVGNHPAVVLASNLYLELGADEYGAAGALLGEPLRVARCERANLEVAAACELVLEGTLDPTEAVDEGPVSEFHGMYERYGRGPVVTFHCLHRRRDAIFQVVEPGRHAEHVLIGAVAIGGAGRLSAVIVLRDPPPGDAKKSMFAAWAAVNLLKNVVVVDADVDPLDPLQVEWAISTRVRAERDVVVVPGVRADRSEPLESDGVVTKLGVDATRSAGDRGDWTRALPPAAVVARVRAELRERAAAAEQGRG